MGSGGRRKRDRGIIQIPRSKRIITGRDNAAMRPAVTGNGHSSLPTRAQSQQVTRSRNVLKNPSISNISL